MRYCRIHFLSLATGEPHSSSTYSVGIRPDSKTTNSLEAAYTQLAIGYGYIGILVEVFSGSGHNSELWVIRCDTATIKVVSTIAQISCS